MFHDTTFVIISITLHYAALFAYRDFSSQGIIAAMSYSGSNDNDKTHFLSLLQSTQLFYRPPQLLLRALHHYNYSRASFFRLGIDGIINKHHTNYSATVLLIFSPHLRGIIHPDHTDATINHSAHRCASRTFISAFTRPFSGHI